MISRVLTLHYLKRNIMMTKLQRCCLLLKTHQGCKNLLTILCGKADLIVQQKPELWEIFHSLIPLKVWNVNPHVIKGKVAVLAAKVTKIIWLKNEENAFGDGTQATSKQGQVKTSVRTR